MTMFSFESHIGGGIYSVGAYYKPIEKIVRINSIHYTDHELIWEDIIEFIIDTNEPFYYELLETAWYCAEKLGYNLMESDATTQAEYHEFLKTTLS